MSVRLGHVQVVEESPVNNHVTFTVLPLVVKLPLVVECFDLPGILFLPTKWRGKLQYSTCNLE